MIVTVRFDNTGSLVVEYGDTADHVWLMKTATGKFVHRALSWSGKAWCNKNIGYRDHPIYRGPRDAVTCATCKRIWH